MSLHTAAPQVVASVIHERLVGVDVAVKVTVPQDAPLSGSLPPPAAAVHSSSHDAGQGLLAIEQEQPASGHTTTPAAAQRGPCMPDTQLAPAAPGSGSAAAGGAQPEPERAAEPLQAALRFMHSASKQPLVLPLPPPPASRRQDSQLPPASIVGRPQLTASSTLPGQKWPGG